MRILRILILIVFLITAGFFGVNEMRYLSDLDDEPPLITANSEEITLSVTADDAEYLSGVNASDGRDGDVTDSLVIAGKSNFIEEGLIRVDYAAFDSHNNVGTYSRMVRYSDYVSPKFVLEEPFMLRKSTSYDFDFIKATDVIDGEISNKVKVLYSNLYSAVTDAPITLEATNSVGDIEKLELNVRILTPQEYALYRPALWGYVVYTTVGERIEPWYSVAGVWQNGNYYAFEETDFDYENIAIDSSLVDYDTPGVYEIIYYLNSPDQKKYSTGEMIQYVVVRDE